jgi:hypothetical protein
MNAWRNKRMVIAIIGGTVLIGAIALVSCGERQRPPRRDPGSGG